jgi:serine/threonine protein phosphatase PrpC
MTTRPLPPVHQAGPYADADTCELPAGAASPAGGSRTVPGSRRAWLRGHQGVAGEFLLASGSVMVGRDPGCGVVLSDISVSPGHAVLDYASGSWWLTPMLESNSTWVNGRLVRPGARIAVGDGDRLRFGPHTQLRLVVPPVQEAPAFRFSAAARTTPGAMTENQDAHLATDRLLAVADGLSDRPSPRVASRTAVREVASAPPHLSLADLVTRVSDAVFAGGSSMMQFTGMATTLDLVRLRHGGAGDWQVEGAHVGDGQVLLQDSHGIRKLTRDHTVGGRLAAANPARAQSLAADPDAARLTAAVGFARPVEPELWWVHAAPGQRLLLSTDGLAGTLPARAVLNVLRRSRSEAPAEVADTLIRMAARAGGGDNVTVIVADVT